jgi:DNA polymerase I-like protein with 3'-5' exonuclease and polymerase domains
MTKRDRGSSACKLIVFLHFDDRRRRLSFFLIIARLSEEENLNVYGRKRYIPELKSSNFNIRSGAERIALNTPIQGTAADLIKLAMIRVDTALRSQYPEAQLILQVHDELIV